MLRLMGAEKVGRFAIQCEVANFGDILNVRDGLLAPEKVRRSTVAGVVDSGATHVVLPLSVAKRLGLRSTGKVKVRYADGRTGTRDRVEGIYLELLGRHGAFSAVVEPHRRTVLLGAIVLEELDLLIDCTHRRLIPRDPRYVITEIE
jgi:predicted aspartyl protease